MEEVADGDSDTEAVADGVVDGVFDGEGDGDADGYTPNMNLAQTAGMPSNQ